jgi:hypothetical protein
MTISTRLTGPVIGQRPTCHANPCYDHKPLHLQIYRHQEKPKCPNGITCDDTNLTSHHGSLFKHECYQGIHCEQFKKGFQDTHHIERWSHDNDTHALIKNFPPCTQAPPCTTKHTTLLTHPCSYGTTCLNYGISHTNLYTHQLAPIKQTIGTYKIIRGVDDNIVAIDAFHASEAGRSLDKHLTSKLHVIDEEGHFELTYGHRAPPATPFIIHDRSGQLVTSENNKPSNKTTLDKDPSTQISRYQATPIPLQGKTILPHSILQAFGCAFPDGYSRTQ